ncbi:LuxR C-terminal-related transcriptional regulator [Streptomyces sp. TP-A0874]|uniref:LuxR C-terminal-related transcriptional regulator n=1 Tax=Streptomyces sp. TP-A0874 TaxID=549819 RepID=UPI0008538193|nr:helix-turn-helix transcriptional regulator [Streptomyces sp. TP-A0874]
MATPVRNTSSVELPDPRHALLLRLTESAPEWLTPLSGLSDEELRELAGTGLFSGRFPAGPDAALRRELVALADLPLRVLHSAAVLGPVCAPTHLATMVEATAHRTLAALDDLVARGLLHADPAEPAFHFRYPLLRALVHALTPPGRRIAAHARAVEVLRADGAPATEIAPHLVRSAAPGDLAAVATLRAAADTTAATEPAQAVRWLRAARRIAPTGREPELDRALTASLHQAADRAGEYRLCRALLPCLRDSATPARWCDIAVVHARQERAEGRRREARRFAERELSRFPGHPPMRRLLASLAAADGELALVRELLDPLPDGAAALDAHAALALAGAVAGDRRTLHTATEQAGALLAVLDDTALAERSAAVHDLVRAWCRAGRWDAAHRLLVRALWALDHSTGPSAASADLFLAQGYVHLAAGRWDAAEHAAHRSRDAAFASGRCEPAGRAGLLTAAVAGWRDGPAPAAALVEHIVREAEPGGGLWQTGTAVLAVLRFRQDRPEECLRLLDTLPEPDAGLLPPLWCAYALTPAPETARGKTASDGRRERAWAAVIQAARDSGYPVAWGLRPADRPPAAVQHSGAPLLECCARLAAADRLAADGRPAEAADEVGRAKAFAEAAQSAWLHRLLVDRQRALGARRPRGTPERADDRTGAALTGREREVVRMVCRGMANRDIAEVLFVSVKTVEAHLTRIFRKTGVGSRTALAGAFAGDDRPALPPAAGA